MTHAPDGQLRIGHAERDAAVAQLRDAAAEGRLTLEELDVRIGVALAARTRDEVRALLADLLPQQQLEAAINPAALLVSASEPGWSWQDPLVLTARWDDVFRGGPWPVPPFLELNPVAGNVKLDFVDARTSTPIIDVNIIGGAGDAILVVPGGWGADVSRMDKGLGSVKSTVDARPTGTLPLLVVRGRTTLGSIRVRHPNWWDTKQRERRLGRGGGIVSKN
ncbi:MAG TPA: DUF1707 domain-containing protein [Propioniciclava sp.]|jgi:hypothetical protein|uniref:DUF1707 SHOCT-like domain-containing protein n=1 Tax=Propioniciclava sp. TaxID=2038686 RepID=UPI002C1D28E1|nr:DUF1707 domain-containing protein [Propioniciclava sp.]HRL48388.1 DUF1707 domain-containing protein [Propioniciclava sp.]HRL79189.1 DUF1707 domain-containing protein [Propioniciclava sp.]